MTLITGQVAWRLEVSFLLATSTQLVCTTSHLKSSHFTIGRIEGDDQTPQLIFRLAIDHLAFKASPRSLVRSSLTCLAGLVFTPKRLRCWDADARHLHRRPACVPDQSQVMKQIVWPQVRCDKTTFGFLSKTSTEYYWSKFKKYMINLHITTPRI